MKLRPLKVTAKNLKELPFRKVGEAVRRYQSIDNRRIFITPNLHNHAVSIKVNVDNIRHQVTVGHYPDDSWPVLHTRAVTKISELLNGERKPLSGKTIEDFYYEIVKPLSDLEHKDSYGFQLRLKPLLEAFGKFKLETVKRSHVTALLSTLQEGRKSPTLARFLAAFSSYFSIAIEHDYLSQNPCKKIKRPANNPPRTRTFSRGELEAFIEGAFEYKNPVMAHSVLLCLFTGQRQGNVRSIELSWFSQDYSTLRFPDSKSGKAIEVQLSQVAIELVKMSLPYSDGKYLFPSHIAGQYIGKPTRFIAAMRKYVRDKTGISEYWCAHDLRHQFSTTLAQVSGDLSIVRDVLGHADIRTTMIYVNPQKERISAANNAAANTLLAGRTLSSFIPEDEEE